MYTHFKTLRKAVLSIIILCNVLTAFSQNVVDATVVSLLLPPYNVSFPQLESQLTVKVVNISNQNAYGQAFLRMSIEGLDNGIFIQSVEATALNPFDINEQEMVDRIGSAGDFSQIFEIDNLMFSGISGNEVFNNGLPPGAYSMCFRLFTNDYEPISIEGVGCSMFTIDAVEPPQLINPYCGDTITTGGNNLLFSWTIPPGTSPATTEYTLKMVELLPGQDPNQAFLSSTVPAFFERSVYSQNSILYGPSDPPLESGKTYAWQIIAREGELNTNFENDGRSQVCWFTWSPTEINIITSGEEEESDTDPAFTDFDIDPQPTPFSSVKGRLLYKFKGDLGGSQTSGGSINTTGMMVDPNPIFSIPNGSSPGPRETKPRAPRVGFPVSTAGAKPLAGVSVSLVVTHLFNGTDTNGSHEFQPLDGHQLSFLNDENEQAQDQVLATTITNNEGYFDFGAFINPHEDYGLVQSDIDARHNSDVQNLWLKGDMYKVVRLKVNNQYYLSPDINITINPFESKDIGTLVSLVKSYNLNVIPKWHASKKTTTTNESLSGLSGVNIHLVRGYTPDHIPSNEGRKGNLGSGILGDVVDNSISGDEGVLLKNLVRHNPNDAQDRYTIAALKSDEGLVNYKNKIKKYNVLVFAEDFPFNSQSAIESSNFGNYLGEKITWNSELKVETFTDILWLEPDNPRIFGRLELAENKQADETREFHGEKVHIIETTDDYSGALKYYGFSETDDNGRYKFDNLPVYEGGFINGKREVVGPARLVYTNVDGFKGQKEKFPALNWGDQKEVNFELFADGFISGYVVDEEGNAITANVNIDSLAVKTTSFGFIKTESSNSDTSGGISMANGFYGQRFGFRAPSGQRKIKVRAVSGNETYAPKDTTITISKKGMFNKPIKITLIKKRKRIRFKVIKHNTTQAISKAKITLERGTVLETTQLTDNEGYVTFVFDSNVNDFNFSVEPPQGKEDDYTTESFVVRGVPNTVKVKTVLERAYLKPTAKITGIVSLVTDDGTTPLQDAIVYFQEGNTQKRDTTDAQGRYRLKGIAKDIGTIQLYAEKHGTLPMIKTDQKEVNIQAENTVDFSLEYDKEVSMASLFGFDFVIVSKEKINDNTFMITEGHLTNIPENSNFKIHKEHNTTETVLPFSNLKIKKTSEVDANGTPIFEPEKSFVTLNDKTLEVKLNDAFKAILTNNDDQLQLKEESGKGTINGNVRIKNVSFEFSEAYVNLERDEDITLTTEQGNKDTSVPVFAIGYSTNDKFGIVNQEDKELQFKLGQFDANAAKDKSYVADNKVVFHTHLETQKIEGIVPEKLKIEAGELTLQPDQLLPINNSNALAFKLEDWDFESDNWTFNTTDLRIEMTEATIKTGTIDVPVKTVAIMHNDFRIDGGFQLDGLNIGGIADLNVMGSSTSFDLNPSVGSDKKPHWELKITNANGPAASITLPGFEAGKTLDFSSVRLLSNGEQDTSINSNEPIKFYNIIDITPNGISSGDGFIDLATSTNLGIPRIPEKSGFIRFKKENGEVKATVSPIPFKIDAPGKVTLAISDDPEKTEIRDGLFKAIGTLTDEEGINLQASIQKTNTKTHIEIEPGQSMQLGNAGTSFKDIQGKMDFDSTADDWTKLTFSGELDGFKGVTPGQRQTFVVHGDIKADSESIAVDNIETPFGELALTYDIENVRFLGHLNINQPLGGMKFVGSADMLMGAEGWYFTAGGKGTPPGIGEISVGMILGDSDYMAPEVTGNLMQFAYDKNVPPTIKNGVSGLFVTGRKDLPIINIPDWSLDLGVISASLGASAGLDARVWMNFDEGGDEFGIGAMAFAHVYFSASSITCTSLGAEARAELGIKGKYQTATGNFNLDGCGSIMVGGHIEQCVPTIFAGCKWCANIGFSEAVKLDLHLDSAGNTDVSFGFGNCSGAPLSNGW